MPHTATLLAVTTMNTHQLAGAVIRDERARRRLTQDDLAELSKVSRPTISRAEGGTASVEALTLRALEGALGLPLRFLTYVIDGDGERIKRLPTQVDDPVSGLRSDLRQYVIEALEDIQVPRNRRVTDRRRRV